MEMIKRITPKYIVIYNPMSAACVIAAAMLFASNESVEVIKITDHLPCKDEYEGSLEETTVYWIGVNPEKIFGLKRARSNYYIPDDGGDVLFVDWTGQETRLTAEQREECFPDGSTIATLHKLQFLPDLQVPVPLADIGFLADHVDVFQNPKREKVGVQEKDLSVEEIKQSLNGIKKEMLLVYYNLGQAQSCLDCEIKYVVQRDYPSDFEQIYTQDVVIAKKRLNKNVRRQKMTNGEEILDGSATSFHDFMVHMALRLLRMSNGLFVNFTHSSAQPVVYTNIRGLVLDQAKYQAIKLEL